MTRTLNSPVGDQRGEYVYLYEFRYSGGDVFINSGSTDILFGGDTYIASLGLVAHDTIIETSDRAAQQLRVQMGGVDQSIISTVLTNNFRGYPVFISLVHFDPDTGVIDTPDLLFVGRQNGDYVVTEEHSPDDSTQSVVIETRFKSALGSLSNINSVRSNSLSHQEMLRRGGIAATADKFFERVASIERKQVYWGQPTPAGRWSGGFGDSGPGKDDS